MADSAKTGTSDHRRDLAREWRTGSEAVRDGITDMFFIEVDDRCVTVTPENVDTVLGVIGAFETSRQRP